MRLDTFLFSVIPLWFVSVGSTSGNIASCDTDSGTCHVTSLYEPGDVILGVMANHHSGDGVTWCEHLRASHVELTSLVTWLVERINQADYISGIKLGVRVMDSCSQQALVPRGLMALVPEQETSGCSEDPVAGILDLQSSDQTSLLAGTLAHGVAGTIPVVSATATAPALSNRTVYPGFLRTIPSDHVAAQAIHDVIQNLEIKYVVILHSGDLYGREGNAALSSLLRQSNICIAATLELQLGDESSVTRALGEVEAKLDKVGGSDSAAVLAVVHYGQHSTAQDLLRQATRLPGSRGRQLLWLMSEAVGRETELYAGHEDLARNVITITPVYDELTEFTQYWLGLLTEYLTQPSKLDTFLYRPYLETLLDCGFSATSPRPCEALGRDELEAAYSQSGYAVVVVDAVVALSQALKDLRVAQCGDGSPGGCDAFMSAVRGHFLDTLGKVQVYYPDLPPSVPAILRNQGRRVSFDSQSGNPVISSTSPSHVIFKYQCGTTNCHFRELATYQQGLRDWHLDGVSFYPYPDNDEPLAAADLPPISCTSACSECRPPGVLFAYIPGEFLLAALLPFHAPSREAFLHCNTTAYRTRLIHSAETILYAVDLFNDPQGQFKDAPLHGRLGAVILDSCQSGTLTNQLIADLHTNKLTLTDAAANVVEADTIVAYVAGHYSSTQLAVTSVLEELGLVQLAYAATSTALNTVPHLLRTIPADDVQVLTILEFVGHMGWTTISILYQDDSYGQAAYALLSELAQSRGLCMPLALAVPVFLTRDQADQIMPKLYQTPDVEVVVLFTGFNETHTLLSVVNDRWRGKHFTWIGSEAWQANGIFLEPPTRLEALGAITVLPRLPDYPLLKDYFSSLTPATNLRDPFFSSFWEHHFGCHLENPSSALPSAAVCHDGLTLDGYEAFYPGAQLLVPAVLSAALGIGQALQNEHVCQGRVEVCPEIRSDAGLEQIVTSIRNVSLGLGSESPERVYTSRGDGNIDYLVMNIQKVGEDYQYVQVGEFHPVSGFQPTANSVRFYTDTEQPKAVHGQCSSDCRACQPEPEASNQAALGGALGGVALILILAVLAVLLYRRRRALRADKAPDPANGFVKQRRDTRDDLPGLPVNPDQADNIMPYDAGQAHPHSIAGSIPQVYLTSSDASYQSYNSNPNAYSLSTCSCGSGQKAQGDDRSCHSYEVPIPNRSPSSPSLITSPSLRDSPSLTTSPPFTTSPSLTAGSLPITPNKFQFPERSGYDNPTFHSDTPKHPHSDFSDNPSWRLDESSPPPATHRHCVVAPSEGPREVPPALSFREPLSSLSSAAVSSTPV